MAIQMTEQAAVNTLVGSATAAAGGYAAGSAIASNAAAAAQFAEASLLNQAGQIIATQGAMEATGFGWKQAATDVTLAGVDYDQKGRISGFSYGQGDGYRIGANMLGSWAAGEATKGISGNGYGSHLGRSFYSAAGGNAGNIFGEYAAMQAYGQSDERYKAVITPQFSTITNMLIGSSIQQYKGDLANDSSIDSGFLLALREAQKANERDQERRMAELFEGWAFWRDEENAAGGLGGLASEETDATQVAGGRKANVAADSGETLLQLIVGQFIGGRAGDLMHLIRAPKGDPKRKSQVEEELKELEEGALSENTFMGILKSMVDDPGDFVTYGDSLTDKLTAFLRSSLGKAQYVLKSLATGALIIESERYRRLAYSKRGDIERAFLFDILNAEKDRLNTDIQRVQDELGEVERKLKMEESKGNQKGVEILKEQQSRLRTLSNRLTAAQWALDSVKEDTRTVKIRQHMGEFLVHRYGDAIGSPDEFVRSKSQVRLAAYFAEHEKSKQLDKAVFNYYKSMQGRYGIDAVFVPVPFMAQMLHSGAIVGQYFGDDTATELPNAYERYREVLPWRKYTESFDITGREIQIIRNLNQGEY